MIGVGVRHGQRSQPSAHEYHQAIVGDAFTAKNTTAVAVTATAVAPSLARTHPPRATRATSSQPATRTNGKNTSPARSDTLPVTTPGQRALAT
jgi:hypothetical protein